MQLIDSLTTFRSGYVLKFSNKTFAEFFAGELDVDIYDERYNEDSGSKGKRFLSFIRQSEPLQVAKLLSAIWEYREAGRLQENAAETIPRARERLSELVVRLGGVPLPSYDPQDDTSSRSTPSPRGPNAAERMQIEQDFLDLFPLQAHKRGYAFEVFLKEMFDRWGLGAKGGFRNTGEQIDGSFELDHEIYLLEAKWHTNPIDAATLHAFQGKLSERPDWGRGLFVSFGGFSLPSSSAFTAKRIILMDGGDLLYTIRQGLHLDDVLRAKARAAVEHKLAFAPASKLFPI